LGEPDISRATNERNRLARRAPSSADSFATSHSLRGVDGEHLLVLIAEHASFSLEGAQSNGAAGHFEGDGVLRFDPTAAVEQLRARDPELARLIDAVGPSAAAA